ncbi:MAG: hypothetical protein GFH25_541186n399 [Chloroflexi bacterium AL-N10]|nr:hypothetical protein [Chloroflexi bacterium AL-N1]NOK66713.1 hypothetical protein [Chloroflexi bacterium AL-N10]NOK72101.1 hypothetical protein [Chloroflexi bacterium AL-N5]
MRALLAQHRYPVVILMAILCGLTLNQTNAQTVLPPVHMGGEYANTYDDFSTTATERTPTPKRIAQAATSTSDTAIGPTPTPATEAERQRNAGRIRPDPLPFWMAGFGAVAIMAVLFVAVRYTRRR